MLQPLVVCPYGAVHKGQDETLKSSHGILHQDGIDGALPLTFTKSELLHVGGLARESGDGKDQVDLGNLVIALHLLRIRDELLVDAEESGFVENRKKRRPLLEVDVDASVRKEARWHPHGRVSDNGMFCQRRAALDVKESFWVEVGAGFPAFLQSPLERLWQGV